jgi:hypothetical protein
LRDLTVAQLELELPLRPPTKLAIFIGKKRQLPARFDFDAFQVWIGPFSVVISVLAGELYALLGASAVLLLVTCPYLLLTKALVPDL